MPAGAVLLGITAHLLARWPLMGANVVTSVVISIAVSLLLASRYIAPANIAMNAADAAMGAALADAVTCTATMKAFQSRAARGPALPRLRRHLAPARAACLALRGERQRCAVVHDPDAARRPAVSRALPLIRGQGLAG